MKKKLISNKTFNKNEVKKLIDWFLNNYGTIKTTKLLDKLKTVGFKYMSKGSISLGNNDLKIPHSKRYLIKNAEKKIKRANNKYKNGKISLEHYMKIMNESWNKTNELLKTEITKNFEQIDLLNPVYMMIVSGARGNISQIKQLIGMRGLIVDSQGEIINTAIKNNLKEGLEIAEYFISCYGARKGIIDTSIKTANSGFLTRKLIYSSAHIIIKKPNCKSKKHMLIMNSKNDKKYFKKINEKIIGRILARNIEVKLNRKNINIPAGQDICKYLAKKLINTRKIYVKSPLNCKLNTGLCQICYGWNLANGRIVELGETVGILAAQSIGEPGTQLTMRTFHTGGIFTSKINQLITASHNGKIFYNINKGGKIIQTKIKEKAFFTLEKKKLFLIGKKTKKCIIKIPKYSILFVKNKEKIKKKQIISELSNWKLIKNKEKNKNLHLTPIKTNITGITAFDRKNEMNKNILWLIEGNIIKHKNILKNIKIHNKKKKIKYNSKEKNLLNNEISKIKHINFNLKLTINKMKNFKIFNKKNSTSKKKFFLNYNVKKIINKEKRSLMNKQDTKIFLRTKIKYPNLGSFFRIKKNKSNLKHIQLLEKQKKGLIIVKTNAYLKPTKSEKIIKSKMLLKKRNKLFFSESDKQKIEDIVEGLPKIQEILEAHKKENSIKNIHTKLKKVFSFYKKKYKCNLATKKSIEKIQNYLVNKIKNVYSNQGVNISEKHFELIVKQMTAKVLIKKEGNSKLINGEIIDLNKAEKINKNLINKMKYEPIVIGITKTSLISNSFLSSASFQETTKVLTKSAIENKIDWLNGLKENIILGNIIPAGTGYNVV
jgi:DNA-directed RNA polymerase subunit beta'